VEGEEHEEDDDDEVGGGGFAIICCVFVNGVEGPVIEVNVFKKLRDGG
jgi:hypothetical protein